MRLASCGDRSSHRASSPNADTAEVVPCFFTFISVLINSMLVDFRFMTYITKYMVLSCVRMTITNHIRNTPSEPRSRANTAFERRGNALKAFEDLCLNAKTGIWP